MDVVAGCDLGIGIEEAARRDPMSGSGQGLIRGAVGVEAPRGSCLLLSIV